jgi:hypothetical protein
MAYAWKRRLPILLLTASTCFAEAAYAQSPSGSISGRVICDDGNVPARGAKVELIPLSRLLPNTTSAGESSQVSPSSSTDFSGFYHLPSVEAGTYIVNATAIGYNDDLKLVSAVLDRYTPDQQKSLLAIFPQVTIKAGSPAHQDVILRRAAAISGHVLVDLGGTVAQARVTATLVASSLIGSAAGEGSVKSVSFSQYALTDDRGVYRIPGLPPGSYRLSVRITENFFSAKPGGPQQVTVLPQRTGLADLTVFASEALEQGDAKLIKVADGDEAADADITIPTRLLHSIGGTVTQSGVPLAGASISLESQGHRIQNSDALSMSDGSYQFDLLPPGNYTVIARTFIRGQASERSASGQLTMQLRNSDVMDADVDIPTQTPKQ